MNKWYKQKSNNNTVISTRIRLARNLKGIPFPAKMTNEQKQEVIDKVKNVLLNGNSSISSEFQYISMDDISKRQAVSLVERHLVSPEFISDTQGRGLLVTKDENISIMINEEDHIRLQVISSGLNLEESYKLACQIDTLLEENLTFDFDDNLGYLTQCPTNLGTGMRASIMLHLPATQDSRAISRIASNLYQIGLTLRGIYGEGSNPLASIYQLSNQVTLGLSEKSAIENLQNMAMQIIGQEKLLQKSMIEKEEMQDIIFRSVGILTSAKLLSNDEFMKLISNVRLGVACGLIENISLEKITELIIKAQPATIMDSLGQEMTPKERDKQRATIVKETLLMV